MVLFTISFLQYIFVFGFCVFWCRIGWISRRNANIGKLSFHITHERISPKKSWKISSPFNGKALTEVLQVGNKHKRNFIEFFQDLLVFKFSKNEIQGLSCDSSECRIRIFLPKKKLESTKQTSKVESNWNWKTF